MLLAKIAGWILGLGLFATGVIVFVATVDAPTSGGAVFGVSVAGIGAIFVLGMLLIPAPTRSRAY